MDVLLKNKILAVFAATGLLSAGIRLFQILALTEYDTGFIKTDKIFLFYFLSVVTAVLIGVAAIYAFISAASVRTNGYYLTVSVSSMIAGAVLAFCAFTDNYAGVPGVLKVICLSFSVLCGLYFIAFALRAVFGFKFPPNLSVLPVIFIIAKTAAIFVRGSYHAVINDTVLEVAAYCFNMLFFLEIARAVNGLGNTASLKKISTFGILAAMFSLVFSVPKIIVALVYGSALHDGAGDSVIPLFIGLHVLSVVFSRVSFVKQENRRMGIY